LRSPEPWLVLCLVRPRRSMLIRRCIAQLAVSAALCSSALCQPAGGTANTDYITPPYTFSPDHHFAVMIPVFHIETAERPDHRRNKLVDLQTGSVIAVIDADPPGYDRALNHHEAPTPRWSTDSSALLWKIGGKWSPDALILLKIEQNRAKWQLDLLKTAQQAVLLRTREAAPEQYKICKKHNAGNGSAFPDGFTVDVTTDGEDTNTVSLPLSVHADLTANPKQIEGDPNLDSHLDGVVTPNGNFVVKDFHLGSQKQ
jgi:hypothetical protein